MHGSKQYVMSRQETNYNCVEKCIYSTIRTFGGRVPSKEVAREIGTTCDGTDRLPPAQYLRRLGFTVNIRNGMTFSDLKKAVDQGPVMVYVDGDHAIMVYGVDKNFVFIMDPSIVRGFSRRISHAKFLKRWRPDGHWGMAIRNNDTAIRALQKMPRKL